MRLKSPNKIGEPNIRRFLYQFGISLVDLMQTFLKLLRYPLSAVYNNDAEKLQSLVWKFSTDFCFMKLTKNIAWVLNRLKPVTKLL